MNHHNDIESLLNQLEDQLQHIETDEYLRGLTSEELEEKGFIGSKPVSIKRAAVIPDVTKRVCCLPTAWDTSGWNAPRRRKRCNYDLHGIPPVKRNQVFATRSLGNKIALVAGKHVRREVREDQETYAAEIDGVAVIAGNGIHVISTDVDCTIELTVSPDRMTVALDAVPGSGRAGGFRPISCWLHWKRTRYATALPMM